MCSYCKDLDQYESRHTHTCTEDCSTVCDDCYVELCLDTDDYDRIEDQVLCSKCIEEKDEDDYL